MPTGVHRAVDPGGVVHAGLLLDREPVHVCTEEDGGAPGRELFAAGNSAFAAGDALLSPSVTRRVLDRLATDAPTSSEAEARLATLTEREVAVLRLVADGRSNAEAAAALILGEATVKTHLGHVYDKLGVNDRAAAVAVAYDRGLLGS